MRHSPLLILALVAFSASAQAQDKIWTPAPTPSIGGGDTIMPAARAGERVVDDDTTPFSGLPTGSVATNGATSANEYNGVATPDLSK